MMYKYKWPYFRDFGVKSVFRTAKKKEKRKKENQLSKLTLVIVNKSLKNQKRFTGCKYY